MPGTIDLVIAVLVAIAYPIWDFFNSWPRMVRTMASGRPNPRLLVYAEVIVTEWTVSSVIAAAWIHAARPWSLIGLVLPVGWRLVVALTLVVAMLMLFRSQVRAVRRIDSAKRDRIRSRMAAVSPLIPHNRLERVWFIALSLTAGLCEEFIYRGFLIWALRPWLGLWGAALASTVSFGFLHAYQGRQGAIRAGMVGAAFAVITIVMGSVVPAMILHALLDVISGEASYAIVAGDSTRAAAL